MGIRVIEERSEIVAMPDTALATERAAHPSIEILLVRCEFRANRDLRASEDTRAPDLGENFLTKDLCRRFVTEAFTRRRV